ncbi:RQC-minor-1 family DNA-binding protein [Desulfitobacterium sp. AusDCA]|uniref:RQC-minor-1 family DNA-binding protein n=1 Tax=Desulfitobacterium sp. AusDCA TaxID=3240383 RepID=UPI003DA6E0B5
MSSKKTRVRYQLDSGVVKYLIDEEIRSILRAADELIAIGGRNLLAKILKGSKDKKVLEHGLNQCPAYGYYQDLTLQEITNRIDWMIEKDYLEIEYRERLPMLVFSKRGWKIERETYAEELLQKLTKLLEEKDYSFVQEMRDRNRGMILLLLEKIRQTGNARFIPPLKAWQVIEYRKVQAEIQKVIDYLLKKGTIF